MEVRVGSGGKELREKREKERNEGIKKCLNSLGRGVSKRETEKEREKEKE